MRLSRSLRAVAAPEATEGVTTLELFFDLVFVFTITQVTSVVRESHGVEGYLRALAILVVTWWMYDGYCWLSNNIGPKTLRDPAADAGGDGRLPGHGGGHSRTPSMPVRGRSLFRTSSWSWSMGCSSAGRHWAGPARRSGG